ncbi:hypothetical protein PG994_009458 [Apiospora phragmitis]|uniref:Uncharacterized protein n=1 Tax=Apiospora phragmitis TaxID=2905665 RepID=A0ABR1UJB6_9PEZI
MKLPRTTLWRIKGSFLALFFSLVQLIPAFRRLWCGLRRERFSSKFDVIFSTSVDIVYDLMNMTLPLALLPKLQLDIRRKAGLEFVFAVGLVIVSVLAGDQVDWLDWQSGGSVEASTSVVVVCLPPLLIEFWPGGTHGEEVEPEGCQSPAR